MGTQQRFGSLSFGKLTGRREGVSYQITNATKPGDSLQRSSRISTRSPPVEKLTCAAFEEYEEVPETVPLDFMKDDVTWVVSNLSVAAGELGADAIELRNWLLSFRCVSEELRLVVAILAYWMANSSPHWAAYGKLMVCCLVALDKLPGVRPVGIGETLRRDLAKIVMREAGEQVKT